MEKSKKALDRLKWTLKPNNFGWLLLLVGLLFIFLGNQINIFTGTDINYSIFGGVLVVFGLLLWLTKSSKRRRY